MNEEHLPPALPAQIPVRPRRLEESPAPAPRPCWLHPASGALILAVDWVFFAPEALTAETAVIITAPLAFLVTTAGVFWIQRKRNGDSVGAALAKGVFGGIMAGIPTPIAGTLLELLVLVLSGRAVWNQRRGVK